VSHLQINTDSELLQFCKDLAKVETIAFDTEFISENSFRSELCLVQVAAGDLLAVIDPLSIKDMTPFWETLVAPGHETVVHAGREELNFCLRATGKRPHNMFDVQIAAGLVSTEYPSGYGGLLSRHLGVMLDKGETRTDWSRRPLSTSQLDYALDDVRHLQPLRLVLDQKLKQFGREEWLLSEMEEWQNEVDEYRSREHWRKMSGNNGLNRRSLGILREVWAWRSQEAERRNQPLRRILRDDLLVEIAKRRSADPKQIQSLRGMERSDYRQLIPQLAKRIQIALDLPEDELPRQAKKDQAQQYAVLGQLLSTALASVCRSKSIAAALVGTASDVRDLIAYRLGHETDQPPLLAQGWRATIVGNLIDDLLAGKTKIRIANPHADDPLVFE
jgi:ribonuclease D